MQYFYLIITQVFVITTHTNSRSSTRFKLRVKKLSGKCLHFSVANLQIMAMFVYICELACNGATGDSPLFDRCV